MRYSISAPAEIVILISLLIMISAVLYVLGALGSKSSGDVMDERKKIDRTTRLWDNGAP